MNDHDIHNFQYFVEELGKTLRKMETLVEQESEHLRTIRIIHRTTSEMCENWRNQLEHQK